MSTVKKGDELRDNVYRLCVASGKQRVELEYPVGGKNADVYFEDSTGFDGLKRYAVECKNYKRPLGREEWREIYTDYEAVKSSYDRLLIISMNGVTDGVRNSIKENSDWITHLTWQQFLFSLLDFKNYFQSLGSLNTDDALNQYYIPPKDTNGNDIAEAVLKWIDGDSNQPLAFLAGYGMGKSSLAKHLASTFGTNFMEGTFTRIPVYIKLGDLFSQQDIKALIINYFAAEHHVGGMSPTLFKEMNRLGLLLIIFDGFDEMKHGMTERDFKRIFTQIKDLVKGEARVMVLGRPSALTSDSDRAVLFGGKGATSIAEAVSEQVLFSEVKIAEFQDSQLATFVDHYLDILNSKRKDRGKEPLKKEIIEKRTEEVLSDQFRELIRRPVHAEMLCKIADAYPEQVLTQHSRYELYDSFIRLFLERETTKVAREAIEDEQRLSFMKAMAWHFWPDKGHQGFTIGQVKSSSVAVPDTERPTDDIYREMLIGSLIERKDENLYFFAHRSFQEYLVAEYIINVPNFNLIIEKLNEKMSTEILNFIEESGYLQDVATKIFEALPQLKSQMRIDLASIFEKADAKQLLKHINLIPNELLSHKQYFLYSKLEYDTYKAALDYSTLSSTSHIASALCGWFFAGASLNRSEFGLELRQIVGLTLMLIKPLVEKANFGKDKARNQILLRDKDEVVASGLVEYLSIKYTKDNEFELFGFDGNGLFDHLNIELSLLEVYPSNDDGNMSLTGIDDLLKTAYKIMGEEITSNDRRHIEYRKNLVKFFRSDMSSIFAVEKVKGLHSQPKKDKAPILTLKR